MACANCGAIRTQKFVTPTQCRHFEKLHFVGTIPFCIKCYNAMHKKCPALAPPKECVDFVRKAVNRSAEAKATLGKATADQKKAQRKDKDLAVSVTLTHGVPQGYWAEREVAEGEVFGTSGLGPCVGMVATYPGSKRVFCAHMDHFLKLNSSQVPSNRLKQCKITLRQSLQDLLPKALEVDKVGVASLNSSPLSRFTIERLKEIYQNKMGDDSFRDADSVYVENRQGALTIGRSGGHVTVSCKSAAPVSSGECHIILVREGLMVTPWNKARCTADAIGQF